MHESMHNVMNHVLGRPVRVTVNIPDETGHAAERAAEGAGQSVSSFYSEAVTFYLRELRRRVAAAELKNLADRMEIAPDAVVDLHELRRENDRS